MNKSDDSKNGVAGSDANRLKRQVEAAVDGQMTVWESDDLSDETREPFWRRVLDIETAPVTTNMQQLLDRGIEVAAPDTMDDDALTVRLWQVIHALAGLRVFLYCTDHLSDRELYTELWERVLRDEVEDLEIDEDSSTIVDFVSTGSEAHTRAWLAYYADDDARRSWARDFPEDPLPPRHELQYRRAHLLPQSGIGEIG